MPKGKKKEKPKDCDTKVLIVFYSHTGSTKVMAKKIAREICADILEIKPAKEVTKSGLKFLWGGAQAVMKKEPELKPLKKDPEDYDVIIIATPVWASNMTPPVRTFLNKHMARKKKVALIAKADGNAGKTIPSMKELLVKCKIIATLELVGNYADKKADFELDIEDFVGTVQEKV